MTNYQPSTIDSLSQRTQFSQRQLIFLFRNLLFLLALASSTWVARAAVGGRISGTISDSSGAVVVGADITALNGATGAVRHTQSDSKGFYSFEDLPIGHYDLEAGKPGFRDYKKLDINVEVNASIGADVSLEVGQATQQVSVNAGTVQIDTSSTQLGEVISGQKMTTVPLDGRSYLDLLALQPGVAPTSSGLYTGAGNVSVNGGRESSNGFMLNGGTVEDGDQGNADIIPNLDSIAEFRIITNNFDAEFGQYSGSQVNVITKSGTNAWHGDVFEFLRNTLLDARNFYSPTRGEYIQNQFGATLGGPILRNKLFFFFDYQGTRQVIGQNSGLISVPSAADRTGNVSDLSSQLTGSVSGSYWAGILSQKLGYAVTTGESYYTPGCTNPAACVFPNAVVPASAIDPITTNVLPYIPAANTGPYFSTSSDNLQNIANLGAAHISWVNQSDVLDGYYYRNGSGGINPYASASFPGFENTVSGWSTMINLGFTKTISSSKLNEARILYLGAQNENGATGPGLRTLQSLGFPAPPAGIFPLAPSIQGVPPISTNEFTFGVPNTTQREARNTYVALDNFSMVKGTHTFKFGGMANYAQITLHLQGYNNGIFNFSGAETGDDFADLLIGAPSYYSQDYEAPMYGRAHYFGLYGEDSWRVKSGLTFNYGLRWEVPTFWGENKGAVVTIVPGLQSVVFPGAPKGLVFPGDPGIPKTLAPTRYNNFAPRLGLAYSPANSGGLLGRLLGGPGNTSIRAAFGFFYTSMENIALQNQTGAAPFGISYSSPVPSLFDTPFIDRATGFDNGQRYPGVTIPGPPPPSHPNNSIDWPNYLPIASYAGTWYKNHVPYSEDYDLSIQRQLGPNSLVMIAYVGTQGHSLLANEEANPGDPALCLSVSQASQVAPGTATCGPFGENGVYTRANGTIINSTRGPLGPAFASDAYWISIAASNYNSLQLTWKYRTGPLEFLAGYTWSKSIDNSSAWTDMLNPNNLRSTRGLSGFNVPQNFVVSYSYALPFANYLGQHRLTNGWVLSGITRFSSGQPVTMTEQDDNSLLGTEGSGDSAGLDVPNYTPGNLQVGANPRACVTNPNCKPYFNTSLFSLETVGFLGNSAHRFITGPGINNFDMALLKDTHITGDKLVELRFESFNLFNHAQFLTPSGNINNSVFGIVTGAGNPRILQVAGKIVF